MTQVGRQIGLVTAMAEILCEVLFVVLQVNVPISRVNSTIEWLDFSIPYTKYA